MNEIDLYSLFNKSLDDISVQHFNKKYHVAVEKQSGRTVPGQYNFITYECHMTKGIYQISIFNKPGSCLPFKLTKTDCLIQVEEKMGKPDLTNYLSDSISYYGHPKEIHIKFDKELDDQNSIIQEITISNHPVKPMNKEEIEKLNTELLELWLNPDKSFGFYSSWIAIHHADLDSLLNYLGLNEDNKLRWEKGFQNISPRNKNFFVTPVINHWIYVLGWGITNLNKNSFDLISLSSRFGDLYVFENDFSYSAFKWGYIQRGKIVRFYSEYFYQVHDNIGELTDCEKELDIFNQKELLFNKDEEYISDQDDKKAYRKFVSESVVQIASKWSIDPRLNNEFKDIPIFVYYKEKDKG